MKILYIFLAFVLAVALPHGLQSQVLTGVPSGVTTTYYLPPITNTTATASPDSREIGFSGLVFQFASSSWPACTSWGLPKSGLNLVDGSTTGSCVYDQVIFTGVNVSGAGTNVAQYDGNTTYRAYTTTGSLNTYTVPIRLKLTVVNSLGAAIPIQQLTNFIYIPIPTGSYTFRVMVQVQAQGPSSPAAVYATSGTGTTGTTRYTCMDYSGTYVGAIQLYNCLQTFSTDQICTTYPGTTNNYQFILGTSTCGLSTGSLAVNSETVKHCNDGSISFTVNKGSCTGWTAKLYNSTYSTVLRTWPFTMLSPVNWTAVAPGAYHVVVEDQTGACAQRLDVTVLEGQTCSISIVNPTPLPTSVQGCNDGSINARINAIVCGNTWSATLFDGVGGIVNIVNKPPLVGSALLWNNLPAGNYSIVAADNIAECAAQVNVTVPNGPPCDIEIQNVQKTVVNCSDNSITADIAALTCNNTWTAYLYVSDYSSFIKQWDNTQGANISWTDIPLGDYHIFATNNAACKDTVDITLTCSDGDPCTNDFCQGSCSHTFKCEDNNPCTEDFCQAGGICVNQPIICNDGDLCTTDACVNGICVATPINCADNNPCTVDQCINGNCAHPPKVCNDSITCTNDFCQAGNCIFQPVCVLNDNNPCTDDHCVNRTCLHVQKNCNDNNTCTQDVCAGGVCVNTPTCVLDDGNPCTTDQCLNGTCAHIPTDCNDNNSCTRDFCQTGGCVNEEICPIDDGNPCTTDQCVNGQCIHTPINCSDNNPCTIDACDNTGNCTHNVFCPTDGDLCTIDSCFNGLCLYPQKNCNDTSSCTTDFCNNGACVNQPLCDLDDGDSCTLDLCQNGVCLHTYICGCTLDSECDDNDLCTLDSCQATTCNYFPAVSCDDANTCTDDYCIGGTCVNDSCDDSNLCTTDSCINGACVYTSRVCPDDGDLCTVDLCISDQCVAEPQNCDDNNACTDDSCNTLSGCVFDPLVCANDGDLCTTDTCLGGQCVNLQITCNDSSACTNDACVNGNCVFTPTCQLNDGDPCTNDTCISGGCVYIPKDCDDGVSCTVDACNNGNCVNNPTCIIDDGDPCTLDGCVNGNCLHAPKSCNDFFDCTDDACQNGICVFDTTCPYNDGNLCTSDFCIGGQCFHQDISCNDGLLCTLDTCHGGVCAYEPIPCDDGNPCTTNSCLNGNCVFTPIPNCTDSCDVIVCSDPDLCTADSCSNGVCLFPPLNCNDNNPCTFDSCNNGICGHRVIGNCNLTISGTVLSEIGAPVRSVTVKLTGSGNQTYTAGLNGQFNFSVVQGDSCIITPSKANDTITNNGVSTLDLILIQRQILAVQPLSSPYKKIAADVNNSKTISTLDIILIRSVILQVALTYPNGRLWAFVSSDFPFSDTLPPFPYDNFRKYPNMTSDQTNQNFIGMKLGDVNNSWNPNIAKLETVGEVQFITNDLTAMTGDEIIVPVKVKDFNKITGFQFTLSWNPEVLQLLEVNNKSINGFFGMNSIDKGLLTTSWFDEMTKDITLNDDEAVFDLKFKVTGVSGSFSELTIGSQLTETEAYNQNLDMLSIVPVNGMVKVGDASIVSNNLPDSYNLRVQPNPFSNSTNIIFTIPQDESVSIIIYDLLGKEVNHILGQFKAGQYSIEWTGDDDAGKSLSHGLYHIRMMTGHNTSSRKVLITR